MAIFAAAAPLFAQTDAQFADNYTYEKIVVTISGTSAPYVEKGFVVFTADKKYRNVGIAFDFEKYSKVHPFQIKHKRDLDDKIIDSVFFYAHKLPQHTEKISYRLVIDGLWTSDPLNPNTHYDEETGVKISHIDITETLSSETEVNGTSVRFVYQGEPNQSVKLTGTFTKWDPWIYELTETRPGFYELVLPLTVGTHYYNYMIGMTHVLDTTNPEKAYTAEGKRASVITIK